VITNLAWITINNKSSLDHNKRKQNWFCYHLKLNGKKKALIDLVKHNLYPDHHEITEQEQD